MRKCDQNAHADVSSETRSLHSGLSIQYFVHAGSKGFGESVSNQWPINCFTS